MQSFSSRTVSRVATITLALAQAGCTLGTSSDSNTSAPVPPSRTPSSPVMPERSSQNTKAPTSGSKVAPKSAPNTSLPHLDTLSRGVIQLEEAKLTVESVGKAVAVDISEGRTPTLTIGDDARIAVFVRYKEGTGGVGGEVAARSSESAKVTEAVKKLLGSGTVGTRYVEAAEAFANATKNNDEQLLKAISSSSSLLAELGQIDISQREGVIALIDLASAYLVANGSTQSLIDARGTVQQLFKNIGANKEFASQSLGSEWSFTEGGVKTPVKTVGELMVILTRYGFAPFGNPQAA